MAPTCGARKGVLLSISSLMFFSDVEVSNEPILSRPWAVRKSQLRQRWSRQKQLSSRKREVMAGMSFWERAVLRALRVVVATAWASMFVEVHVAGKVPTGVLNEPGSILEAEAMLSAVDGEMMRWLDRRDG